MVAKFPDNGRSSVNLREKKDMEQIGFVAFARWLYWLESNSEPQDGLFVQSLPQNPRIGIKSFQFNYQQGSSSLATAHNGSRDESQT